MPRPWDLGGAPCLARCAVGLGVVGTHGLRTRPLFSARIRGSAKCERRRGGRASCPCEVRSAKGEGAHPGASRHHAPPWTAGGRRASPGGGGRERPRVVCGVWCVVCPVCGVGVWAWASGLLGCVGVGCVGLRRVPPTAHRELLDPHRNKAARCGVNTYREEAVT
jgi:hypothetical protein